MSGNAEVLSRNLAEMLATHAYEITTSIYDNLVDKKRQTAEDNFHKAVAESLIFFYFKAERHAQLNTGTDDWEPFMSDVLSNLFEVPASTFGSKYNKGRSEIRRHLTKLFKERVEQYSKCKTIFPREGERFCGYLDWEAGKNYSKALVGRHNAVIRSAFLRMYNMCLYQWYEIVKELCIINGRTPVSPITVEGKRGKTILLLDDEKEIRELVASLLIDKGYKVIQRPDPRDIIDVLEKYTIHLVLLDIMIPFRDGIQVLQDVRGYAKFKKIPIVMWTNLDSDDIKDRCRKAGCDGYLSYSAEPLDQLIGKVGKLLPNKF